MKYLLVIAICMVASCGPEIRVYSDHDPAYQIKNFQTFDWAKKTNIENNESPLYYNELNDKRIKTAVMGELTQRGYSYSEINAEMIVHYHIVIDDQSVVTTEPYGYFYGPYWMRMHTHTYTYQRGTLIIDLMDPKNNNLVWRGWATAALDEITLEETEDIIDRAVAKIFNQFPRSKKSSLAPLVSK